MPLTLDFSQSGDDREEFGVLSPGRYEATVFNISREVGRSSGQPYLSFDFKLKDSAQHLWHNFSLQPQALWAFKRFLIAMGFSAEELAGEVDVEIEEMLGKEVTLVVTVREYEGKDTNDVEEVLPAGQGASASW